MDQQPEHPALEPARFCRRCGYELRGLTIPRCPECGRAFDPTNPKTFRRRPIRRWLRHVKRAAIVLGSIVLLLAAVWGWFFWGWYQEQRALAELKLGSSGVCYTPIVSPWLEKHLGPAGFVLDRGFLIGINERPDITDLSPLARVTELRRLTLCDTNVKDLLPLSRLTKLKRLVIDGKSITDSSPLGGITSLQKLFLLNTDITDISPVAPLVNLDTLMLTGNKRLADVSPLVGLAKLKILDLAITSVADVSPLAKLKNLCVINLDGTKVKDLSPLAGLTELNILRLDNTPVTDVSPLAGIKSLVGLKLPKETITDAQVQELQRALPACKITRE